MIIFFFILVSNVCQNGLSPGVVVKTEGGDQTVPLPAVPLPESVARSLSQTGPPCAPFSVPGAQQLTASGQLSVGQVKLPVTSGSPGAPQQASTPTKPLFRPFGLSPPPPSIKVEGTSAGATPPGVSQAKPPIFTTPPGPPGSSQHHPAYRPFDPPYGSFPTTLGYNPYSYQSVSSAPPTSLPTGATPTHTTHGPATPYNSLFPPPKTTTPTTLGATHTVPASHQDLTCKSHLPKLAHALTNTAPRVTPTGATPISTTPSSIHQGHPQPHPHHQQFLPPQQQQQLPGQPGQLPQTGLPHPPPHPPGAFPGPGQRPQLPPPGGAPGSGQLLAHHQPKSSYPSLPLNDPANLRRELDNRYLHDRNLAGVALRPPPGLPQPFLGSDPHGINNPLASSLGPPLQRPPGSFLGPLVSMF